MPTSAAAGHRAMGLAFFAGLLLGMLAIWPAVGGTLAAVDIGSQTLGHSGRLLLFSIALIMFTTIGIVVVYFLI